MNPQLSKFVASASASSADVKDLLAKFAAMVNPIAAAAVVGLLGFAFKSLRPPRPKICGSPGGPPVTSPRVRLSDGRHLAYREVGVPKQQAKYKIIVIHGFGSSKDLNLPVSRVCSKIM